MKSRDDCFGNQTIASVIKYCEPERTQSPQGLAFFVFVVAANHHISLPDPHVSLPDPCRFHGVRACGVHACYVWATGPTSIGSSMVYIRVMCGAFASQKNVRMRCRPRTASSVCGAVRVWCCSYAVPFVRGAVRVCCRPRTAPSVCGAVRARCRPRTAPPVRGAVRVCCRTRTRMKLW